MPRRRHEIPTHLNVEDKAFIGLSVRQLMNLIVGLSTAYAIWNGWPVLPLPVRAAVAGACSVGRPGAHAGQAGWSPPRRMGLRRTALPRNAQDKRLAPARA